MSATSKASPGKAGPSAGLNSLPAAVYFDGDKAAIAALGGLQRYARLPYSRMEGREAETVLLVSSERLLHEHADVLRLPNVRVVALSDSRFRDVRLDGAVYAYLPAHTPPALVERVLDNALEHIHLLQTRREVNERLAGATREIADLNSIGTALSAEHDTEKLLDMILSKSREITRSDAGSLYLVEEVPIVDGAPALPETAGPEYGGAKMVVPEKKHTRKILRFKLTQNDTIEVPFREFTMDISDRSIAGYVALTGETVNLEDAYHLPEGMPFSYNRSIDEGSGYRTKSMLTVPMRNAKGEIVGVLQLINAKRDPKAQLTSLSAVLQQVVPYTLRQQELLASLASQAAVALENSRLYEGVQRLLEGFVKASVIAIEARDPTTSGHSFRVANLTVALAETADRTTDGPYREVSFTREQMREIRYASLLHDFGKVGVREEVLVKAKKLYPEQLELIRQRFHFVMRTMQYETSQRKLQYLLEKGRAEFLDREPGFDQELARNLREVDDYFQIVLQSNEPTVLPAGSFERLGDIAARHFADFEGKEQALLTDDEVRLLSIRKGSLDETERRQIESHVVHTYNFLSQIPWTREIASIPEIARSHHEKLSGSGYPNKLTAPEIPLQTRMMTISDIFDALAASDRPYKKAVSTERALEILAMSVEDGELDANLFRLFVEAKVFERWKIEPYPY